MFLLLTFACTGDEELLVFPEGLAALAVNTAPLPDGEAETFEAVWGEEYEYDWVHGQGYIHAPVSEVWLAFQELDVVVDRAAVHEYGFTGESDPDFDVSFRVHNRIYDLVTVEYERDWRQSIVGGTLEAPEGDLEADIALWAGVESLEANDWRNFEGGHGHLGTGGSLGDHSWGDHWGITGNFEGDQAHLPTGGSLGDHNWGDHWGITGNSERHKTHLATGGSQLRGSLRDHW